MFCYLYKIMLTVKHVLQNKVNLYLKVFLWLAREDSRICRVSEASCRTGEISAGLGETAEVSRKYTNVLTRLKQNVELY